MPPDPFADDPNDPAKEIAAHDEPEQDAPVTDDERSELLADLADLAVYQALLEPRGIRGIVVDCGECDQPHFHDWHLLRAGLEQLLETGQMRPHEPAAEPDPANYVSWDYCRGFADGVATTENADSSRRGARGR